MTQRDRQQWDRRHRTSGMAPVGYGAPHSFRGAQQLFPTRGTALELACGRGGGAVWLASRGMQVWGVDVSAVAIELARGLAAASRVADRCRFDRWDLDHGLPDGPLVDLVMCHKFWDARLNTALIGRLAPGGLLAVAVLSEVGAGPGPHRAHPGALRRAFGGLKVIDEREEDGTAWIIARRP